ncbi:MAG: DUF302 domain-containing protein [Candidatus Methylomirabilales bacterium]
MLYVTETTKDFETAVKDLEEAVKRHKYGVLHIHDVQRTLKEKGIDFPNRVRILEVCNPQRASRVLTAHMPVNLALPCRISVFEQEGKIKIGMIKPTFLLSVFPHREELKAEAEAVEQDTVRMIDEAR